MIEIEQIYIDVIKSEYKEGFDLKSAVKTFIKLQSIENNKFVPPVAKINNTYKLTNEEFMDIFEVSEKIKCPNVFGFYLANIVAFDNPTITEKLIINTFRHNQESKEIEDFLKFIFTLFCLGIYQSSNKDSDILFKEYKVWILETLLLIDPNSKPQIILPN